MDAPTVDPRAGLPDTIAPDPERYQVHSRLEIIALLRSLIEHRALVTAVFGRGDDFIVTALLSVNPDFEELIFDYGADEKVNERMLKAERLELSSQLDHIKIVFTATRAEATTFEDGPAFRMRLPAAITRLQRRENYRIKLPLGQPVHCRLHWDPANPESLTSMRIADLSCGGLALVDYADSVKLVPGTVYRDCHIGLGEIGTVTVDLEIVHVVEMTLRNNTRSRRCGCRFVKPSNAMGTLIQRYINQVEREQKART